MRVRNEDDTLSKNIEPRSIIGYRFPWKKTHCIAVVIALKHKSTVNNSKTMY